MSTITASAAVVNDAVDASLVEYVNYMDIKLEGVHHLPADWLSAGFPVQTLGTAGGPTNAGSSHAHGHDKEGSAEETEVAYAYHPFRYEVTLALPAAKAKETAATDSDATGTATGEAVSEQPSPSASEGAGVGISVVSFTRGRLLLPLPQYTEYIAAAEPPPAPGVDDASPLRDVPVAISAENLISGAGASGNERETSEVDKASGKVTTTAAAATAPPAATPAILWVMTERTDAPGASAGANCADDVGIVATKRRAKLTTSLAVATTGSAAATAAASSTVAAAAAAAAAVPGAPAPPLPESSEPAPCVVRVPLTAVQEAYLDGLLEAGEPLKLSFRRVLRPSCPAEWEDFNADYFAAEIPISLQALREPGSTHLAADVALQPASAPEKRTVPGSVPLEHNDHGERGKKRSVTRKQRQMVPSILIDVPDRDAPHPYVTAGTMATVSLTLQRTLTRLVSDRVRPAVTPAQLIPPRPTPTVLAAAASDVQTCLEQTLLGIVRRLVRDMLETAQNKSCGSSESDKVAWHTNLVSALQSTGELAAFKSQLTPLVAALVQERLRRDPTAGGSPQEVARASNELYVRLTDMLHSALHECVGEGDAVSSGGVLNSGEEQEVRWRAIEAEVSGDFELAAKLYQSRLATHVAGDNWPALWIDCAVFYQRTEELAKAEQCYREAIACDPGCTPALLDYGAWLLAHDRLDEAAVFLHGLVDFAPQHKLGWGCIALLADLHELAVRVGSPDAAVEQKKWRREQRLALRKAVECGALSTSHATGEAERGGLAENSGPANASFPTPPPAPPQQGDEEEQMYFEVATYLVNLHHRDLANVCLARCRPGEPRVELLYARLFAQGEQYEEALNTLDEIRTLSVAHPSASAAEQRLVDECALLRAECAAALGRPSEAVRMYKQALCRGEPATAPPYLAALVAHWQAHRQEVQSARTVDQSSVASSAQALLDQRITEAEGMHYLSAYLRLCNLLLAEGRYRDALGVVTLALQVWPSSSVLWLGAGVAYYRAGDLLPAEECLQESNTLNPANPRTWAYLALLAVRLQNVGVEEVMQQLLTLNLEDAPLWAELGRTLLGTAQFPRLSVLCLRRAAALVDGKGDAANTVWSSTQYHLAHALMDLQQWEEAEQLLRNVASQSGSNEVLRGKAEEELAMLRAGQ
ncbi:Tetratricopeptide repeat [Leishmania braziliensis]|nr:Tetratricopeptide repeat [Leishmania braziliensis]